MHTQTYDSGYNNMVGTIKKEGFTKAKDAFNKKYPVPVSFNEKADYEYANGEMAALLRAWMNGGEVE